jgi:hypothetical protein
MLEKNSHQRVLLKKAPELTAPLGKVKIMSVPEDGHDVARTRIAPEWQWTATDGGRGHGH